MGEILKTTALSKTYAKYGPAALDSVDLTLESGRIVGLLGPNGSGKTTLIKMACGLLQPTSGEILIDGMVPGTQTKAIVSYLPEREVLPRWMKAADVLAYFADFYTDFNLAKAHDMLGRLNIVPETRISTMSKGTLEKMQLVMVMSREAKLYLLDEPIGGVDPAARDYILNTIITNYSEDATVVISTHLIADIEKVLDEVVLLRGGQVVMSSTVDDIRAKEGKSVDALFREVFKC